MELGSTPEQSTGKSLSLQENIPLTQHLSHSRDKGHFPSFIPKMLASNIDQINSSRSFSKMTTPMLNKPCHAPILRSNHEHEKRNITTSSSTNLP